MLIASLLFGISASLDALLVGISYGIRGIRIRHWQNLAISLVTLLGTCLSVGLGRELSALLPSLASKYAGSLVLILLGLYYTGKWIAARLRSHSAFPGQRADPVPEMEKASCLKPAEVLSLSLTLSLNNLSAGFSASLAGLPLACAAASTFACSVLFLSSGNRLGKSPILLLAGCAAEPLSGLLLIGLGLIPIFLS